VSCIRLISYPTDDDGKQIGMNLLGDKLEHEHGAPWYVIHVSSPRVNENIKNPTTNPQRTELYNMLLSLARPFMKLTLNSKVKRIDPDTPSVTLVSGITYSADLIIGADGIHSVVRSCIIGRHDVPLSVPVGDMAYRALIPTETFLSDPDLRDLVEDPRINCWMGPLKHIIGYCVVRTAHFSSSTESC
jgi:salicylate hydroxylase